MRSVKKSVPSAVENSTTNISRAAKPMPTPAATGERLVSELGWTREQAAQVRASLQAFDEDWGAPGMESYDRL